MTIKLRIILATAALICVVVILNVAHYVAATTAGDDTREVGNRKIPELLALQDMRFGIVRIILSTTEHALLAVTNGDGQDAIKVEERQREESDAIFADALRRYNKFRPAVGEADREHFNTEILAAYAKMIRAGDDLISSIDRGINPERILALKDIFEERELEILDFIGNHLVTDSAQTRTALQTVIGKIDGAERFAIAIGGIALASFLIYGIFVFNMVQNLATARDRATTADRAKSAFLSSMSHELRTPMNAILGFAQILEANPKQPLSEDQARCLRHITDAGNDLMGLIDKILLFSEIDGDRIVLAPERMAIGPIVQECLDLSRGDAEERNIKLIDAVADTGFPEIHTDPHLLKTILLALLSNAVAYNRDDGEVTVSAEVRAEGWLRIAVADTGQGIARDKQHQLFQPFHRLDIVHSNISGSGLGLSVAKDLTKLIGGRIGFKSEAGQGSTFWIEFPTA